MQLPYPVQTVDQSQLSMLVRYARSCNPNWRPPKGFEFDYHVRDDVVSFKNDLASMRRKMDVFWAAVPLAAKLMYYGTSLSFACELATAARYQGQRIMDDADRSESYKEIEALITAGWEKLNEAKNKIVSDLVGPLIQGQPKQGS